MDTIETKLLSDYGVYWGLIRDKKVGSYSQIQLMPGKVGKKDWNLGYTPFKHLNGTEGYLDVEQSKKDPGKYRFILFIKSYATECLCRFDSAGKDHVNINADDLSETKVYTPHFHQYDKDGVLRAFKTLFLRENETLILTQINEGWGEMCREFSIFAHKDHIAYIADVIPIFSGLPNPIKDPHDDVPFE